MPGKLYFLFRGLQESNQHCVWCCVVAGAGRPWCLWEVSGHHQVHDGSAHTLWSLCDLQMPHGSQARVPAESYSQYMYALKKYLLGTDRIAAPTLTHWQVLVPL